MTQNEKYISKTSPNVEDPREGKQTNLAEGERDIIEESIRIHERKGDLPSSKPPGGKGDQPRKSAA